MAELVLDVHLEVNPAVLVQERDPTRAVAEMARKAAEAQCTDRRAHLRHPDPRDVVVRRAIDPTSGNEVLLVATRWLADGPATT